MKEIIIVTFKGITRDSVFRSIMVLCFLLLIIPSLASLSMRQVTELVTTFSLSLVSLILLILSVFLGATSIWRDMERRYTFSVLSLPITRYSYLLGRFLGVALFVLLTAVVLGTLVLVLVKISSIAYPASRQLIFTTIFLSVIFDALKYIVLVAVAITFSTVSTSFFLPVFGAIATFLAGTVTQQVYDYLHTASGLASVSGSIRQVALALYYLLPNLAGFDLKANAIYSLPLDYQGLFLTILYFLLYTGIVLLIGVILLVRRELR